MATPEIIDPGNVEVLPGAVRDPDPQRRRRWPWALLVVIVLGAVGLIWWRATGLAEPSQVTVADEPSFAEVVVTDLVETSEFDGTMGRLDGDSIAIRLEGTVTAVPESGTVLDQGDVAVWVDNQPVALLKGSLPMWRELREGIEGPDVLQLETALVDLGFDEDGSMTVDEEFTAATRAVVEGWQEAIGADDDGVVGLGEIIFISGPMRLGELGVAVGDQVSPGSVVFTTSGEEVEVGFGLPTFEQGNVDVGDLVEVTLPDLSVVTGVVAEIATVATIPTDGGEATFEVTVELDDPDVADGIDDAPVTVAVITDRVDGVTAVPVEALVALAEGGYAVEVGDGSDTRLVAVEPGFYADGLVEVTGAIVAGDQVVVP